MPLKPNQPRRGTQTIPGSANTKADAKGRDDGTKALAGPRGSRSTHHIAKASGRESVKQGKRLEGQERRGYVRDGGRDVGEIVDVTVGPDGTRRVEGDKG